MKTDLLHNKIIKDTITPAFSESFEENLLPLVVDKYGESVTSLQMYEDYLNEGFYIDGEFYYPLTLVVDDTVCRQWIKWNISSKKHFVNAVPYAYVGEERLAFALVDEVPEEFDKKLESRGNYFEGGYVAFDIQTVTGEKTFLSGKYSQTFIDEMVRQLSCAIESAFSVEGISESGVELIMMFAPGTYMEHVVENVTYRRLLLKARGCSARDFWIKWTRLDSSEPLTVSDNVTSETVKFEIGEDVPQKIKEKEYRFLVRSSADKYQNAMGRKNVTEWRDVIKRVIKRGELIKLEVVSEEPEANREISYKLQELLTGRATPEEDEAKATEPSVNDAAVDLAAILKGVLAKDDADDEEIAEEEENVSELTGVEEYSEAEEDEALAEEESPESDYEEISEETENEETEETEEAEESPSVSESAEEILKRREAELRRQIEAELREKLAKEAQERAEAEAEELRRAKEALKAENERLAAIARAAEETKRELEAREHAEARERERLAEAARLAVLEQQRLAEEEKLRKAEEERRREELARAEEEARINEARRLEEERIKREMQREAEAREAEARRIAKAEEDARIAAAASAASAKPTPKNYTYVSKNARLLFKNTVDPNITKRIHEIILTTIKYFHKEDVYIKIKATVPDATTVNLNFVKIPEEETELLINIIKVLGKSGLGITKVILE